MDKKNVQNQKPNLLFENNLLLKITPKMQYLVPYDICSNSIIFIFVTFFQS